jgi:hypothetical protein
VQRGPVVFLEATDETTAFALSLGVLTPVAALAAGPSKLVISFVIVAPDAAESIVIYNPGAAAVDLSNYYLSDTNTYYTLPDPAPTVPMSTDFVARFPQGASIGPGETQSIALHGADCFKSASAACGNANGWAGFGVLPTYEIQTAAGGDEVSVLKMLPAFTGALGAAAGLTNGGEPMAPLWQPTQWTRKRPPKDTHSTTRRSPPIAVLRSLQW